MLLPSHKNNNSRDDGRQENKTSKSAESDDSTQIQFGAKRFLPVFPLPVNREWHVQVDVGGFPVSHVYITSTADFIFLQE